MADPDWMSAGGPPAQEAAPAAPASSRGVGPDKKAAIARVAFKCFHMSLAVFMAWTAIEDYMHLRWASTTSGTFFIATYVLFFAALLFSFETLLIRPCPPIDRVYRANFGFLYRPLSKALFFIFLAFLEFGLETGNGNIWGIVCGALLIADGVLYGMCAIARPHYIREPAKGSTYSPPEPAYAGGSSGQPAWSNV